MDHSEIAIVDLDFFPSFRSKSTGFFSSFRSVVVHQNYDAYRYDKPYFEVELIGHLYGCEHENHNQCAQYRTMRIVRKRENFTPLNRVRDKFGTIFHAMTVSLEI